MLCYKNDSICMHQTIGSFIMTTHTRIIGFWCRRSWSNATFLCSVSLHILSTWLLVTFGCSPNWWKQWKDMIWFTTGHYAVRSNDSPFLMRFSSNDSSIEGMFSFVCAVPRRVLSRGFEFQTYMLLIVFFLFSFFLKLQDMII